MFSFFFLKMRTNTKNRFLWRHTNIIFFRQIRRNLHSNYSIEKHNLKENQVLRNYTFCLYALPDHNARRGGAEVAGKPLDRKIRVRFPTYLVEDETHFLFQCPAHASDRNKLISLSSEICLNFSTLQDNEQMICYWTMKMFQFLIIYATSLQNAHSLCPSTII